MNEAATDTAGMLPATAAAEDGERLAAARAAVQESAAVQDAGACDLTHAAHRRAASPPRTGARAEIADTHPSLGCAARKFWGLLVAMSGPGGETGETVSQPAYTQLHMAISKVRPSVQQDCPTRLSFLLQQDCCNKAL